MGSGTFRIFRKFDFGANYDFIAKWPEVLTFFLIRRHLLGFTEVMANFPHYFEIFGKNLNFRQTSKFSAKTKVSTKMEIILNNNFEEQLNN